MTPEEYWQLFENQGRVCKICRRPSGIKLDVDHNHKTGENRGLLCRHCNTGIGLLDEDIKILESAIAYLKEYEKSLDKQITSEVPSSQEISDVQKK